jgi:predicted alpha-1,2-mannosidase
MMHYLDHGWVSAKADGYSASASLDYAYDDWCVAQVAAAMGKTSDHDELMKRSQNYRASWDPKAGFFRPHNPDGSWAFEPFDPLAWGHGYVEGGPWQCGWAVQQDVNGMAELLGGKAAMADKLDRLLGQPSAFHIGGFPGVIHEMTEMAREHFGQYDQGNQPGHHILYLYSAIGQPWKTQYWTRRVCQELYNPGPRGFPGDEDNGEMASWFILSSTGLYPLCVGDPAYTVTSPLFDTVSLHLGNGKTFTVAAAQNGAFDVYVNRRTLNGQPFDGTTIPHDTVMAGGELNVEMSEHSDDRAR